MRDLIDKGSNNLRDGYSRIDGMRSVLNGRKNKFDLIKDSQSQFSMSPFRRDKQVMLQSSPQEMGDIHNSKRAGQVAAKVSGIKQWGNPAMFLLNETDKPHEFKSYKNMMKSLRDGTFHDAKDEWAQNRSDRRWKNFQKFERDVNRFGGADNQVSQSLLALRESKLHKMDHSLPSNY